MYLDDGEGQPCLRSGERKLQMWDAYLDNGEGQSLTLPKPNNSFGLTGFQYPAKKDVTFSPLFLTSLMNA